MVGISLLSLPTRICLIDLPFNITHKLVLPPTPSPQFPPNHAILHKHGRTHPTAAPPRLPLRLPRLHARPMYRRSLQNPHSILLDFAHLAPNPNPQYCDSFANGSQLVTDMAIIKHESDPYNVADFKAGDCKFVRDRVPKEGTRASKGCEDCECTC